MKERDAEISWAQTRSNKHIFKDTGEHVLLSTGQPMGRMKKKKKTRGRMKKKKTAFKTIV